MALADWDGVNTDLTIFKDNPWLTLHSSSQGDQSIEQAAGVSIGESGKTSSGSLHLTYQGDGNSYIGMGSLQENNIPEQWAMKMNHQNSWVQFKSQIHLGENRTQLQSGGNSSLKVATLHGHLEIGPKNSAYCHYSTDREGHYFDQNVHVRGDIYTGPSYNQRVLHEGNISSYLFTDRRDVKTAGALAANSKNHLTTDNTFTLPAVSNLSEGTTVIATKAIASTPTIEVEGSGSEQIYMLKRSKLINNTAVLFDAHRTMTFILNSEKQWELIYD